LEGTLRGHIGLIEALDRLEGTATEADRGKKMYGFLKIIYHRYSLLIICRNEYYEEKAKG
jgi:hypothetical protein